MTPIAATTPTTANGRTSRALPRPDDLVPAHVAVHIACASAATLKRWAAAGKLRSFSAPNRKCAFYSRAEVEKLAPR